MGARGDEGVPALRLAGEVPHDQRDVLPAVWEAEAASEPSGHPSASGAAAGEACSRGSVAASL